MSDSSIEMTQKAESQVVRLEDRTDLDDAEKSRLLSLRETPDLSTDKS